MALADCIDQVCDSAKATNTDIAGLNSRLVDYEQQARAAQEAAAKQLQAYLDQSAATARLIQCVVTGAAGQLCSSGSVQHITLAEALARLNALSIAGMQQGTVTAAGADTTTAISAAPANPAALNVWLNGAEMTDPTDYAVAGTTITWAYPLSPGDVVDWTVFTV